MKYTKVVLYAVRDAETGNYGKNLRMHLLLFEVPKMGQNAGKEREKATDFRYDFCGKIQPQKTYLKLEIFIVAATKNIENCAGITKMGCRETDKAEKFKRWKTVWIKWG